MHRIHSRLYGKFLGRSESILKGFAEGLSEREILEANPGLTRLDIIRAAFEALSLNNVARTRDVRASAMLKRYPRAFHKWSHDEDMRVVNLYRSGKTLREIAAAVERHPNAIRQRLAKVEKC